MDMSVAYDRDDDDRDEVTVVEMTGAQYRAARQKALRSLGLTYKQLAEEARRREFSSPQAHNLWVAIGGTGV